MQFHSGAYSSTSAAPTTNGWEIDIPALMTTLHTENEAFQSAVRVNAHRRRELIATADDLQQNLYILMKGQINFVCKNSQNRRLVITTLTPGAVFGQGALQERDDVNVFVEAMGDVTIWSMPAHEARDMAIQHPVLSFGMLKTYGERLSQVESNLEDIAYKKLPARLALLLLDLNEHKNGPIRGFSHQALADYLGTYRETVSAALREFKRQELVELGYRYLRVLDAKKLKEIGGIW